LVQLTQKHEQTDSPKTPQRELRLKTETPWMCVLSRLGIKPNVANCEKDARPTQTKIPLHDVSDDACVSQRRMETLKFTQQQGYASECKPKNTLLSWTSPTQKTAL